MRLLIASVLYLLTTTATQAEVTLLLEQELAVDKHGHANKLETRLIPELKYELSDNWQMTLIGDLRYDQFKDLQPSTERPNNYSGINGPLIIGSEGSVAIKEWFVDGEVGNSYWRVGKQQVVWGQADGLKILDFVNPQSYSEFILQDFEDSRIPLWMLNIDWPINDDSSLQILWISDPTYNEFAVEDSTFYATSELLSPALGETNLLGFDQQKPSASISDSDYGLRYSSFLNGWDLTLNWLYHYHDSPVILQRQQLTGVFLESRYFRNHLIGASASNAFGDYTFRAEVGYNSDTYHYTHADFSNSDSSDSQSMSSTLGVVDYSEFASVFGVDWQGIENTMLSLQWFQSYLFDYKNSDSAIRKKQTNTVSLLYRQTFNNETWNFDLLALHGLEYADNSLQLKLSYQLESNFDIWVGVDIFSGNPQGLFGQFDQTDRLTLGWRWGI